MSKRKIFDESFYKLLAEIILKASPSGGRLEGARASNAIGAGIDFADWRAYARGDNPKDIDWRAYARSGKKFVRLYSREEASNIYILIDTSESMRYGKPEKLFYAYQLAAILGAVALSSLDSLTLLSTSNSQILTGPTMLGADNIKNAIRFIEKLPATKTLNLAKSIEQFLDKKYESGSLIIISDFLGDDTSQLTSALKLAERFGYDGALIQILSPEELSPTQSGALKLQELESDDSLELELTPSMQTLYIKELNAHTGFLRKTAETYNLKFSQLQTATPLFDAVTKHFKDAGIVS